MQPIKFNPVYQTRVWGGRALADKLGRDLPGTDPIGESWELVDRPEAQSVDPATGKTLRELLETAPEELMGPGFDPARPFPVLVKWLDCSQRLSLQVHPPADVAQQLGGEAKTEFWYIAETKDDAALIVGLKQGVSQSQFEQAIQDEGLEPLVHRVSVEPGQSMLLEAGRLHAIDAGNLILEIQQNSDTTYRVYDWGRKGLDGKPRQLHVKQSLQSIDFNDFEPEPNPTNKKVGEHLLADCTEFRIRQVNFHPGQTIQLEKNQQPRILSVISGNLIDEDQHFSKADNILIPYSCSTTLTAENEATVLITDRLLKKQPAKEA